MNSIERVFAAILGNPADRRAFTLTLSLYGANLTGCPLSRYFTDPKSYLAGQRAVRETITPDILFGPFIFAYEGRAFGCELLHQDNGPPNVRRPAIRSIDDIGKLKVPSVESDPGLAYIVESVRLLAEEFKDEAPVAAVVTAPTDLPALFLGLEQWLEILLFQPDIRKAVLDLTGEYFTGLTKALMEAGAGCLAMPVMLSNPRVINPDLAASVVLPALAEFFSQCPGKIVFHHGGNRIGDQLENLRGLPNLLGFALDERDDPLDARKVIGSELLLMGNLSGPHLVGRTPADISERVRKILDKCRDDKRFILATSNADIPLNTPLENILAVREAVLKYGGMQ